MPAGWNVISTSCCARSSRAARPCTCSRARRGAAPDGASVQRIAWADEHDAPDERARAETARALADFAPDVAVAHNVMDAGVVEALRAAPRLAYHVHDHRPFCPNGDRVFPRSGRICTQPLGLPCAVHALLDGCAYGPRPAHAHADPRAASGCATRSRPADASIVASRYVGDARRAAAAYRASASPRSRCRCRTTRTRISPSPHRHRPEHGRCSPGASCRRKGSTSLVRAVARIAPERRPRVRALGDGPALDGRRAPSGARSASRSTRRAPSRRTPCARRSTPPRSSRCRRAGRSRSATSGIEAFARARHRRRVRRRRRARVARRRRQRRRRRARATRRALADAIAALLDDDARRTQLARRARADAERFRAAPVVDALLSAYRPG